MQKILRFILFSGHKRRRLAVGVILWSLRQILDFERYEMDHSSDMLDSFDLDPESISRSEYSAAEDAYSSSEYAAAYLESAIDDLEFAY